MKARRFMGEKELAELDLVINGAASETQTVASVEQFGLYQAVLRHGDGTSSMVTVQGDIGELEQITSECAHTMATEQPREWGWR